MKNQNRDWVEDEKWGQFSAEEKLFGAVYDGENKAFCSWVLMEARVLMEEEGWGN